MKTVADAEAVLSATLLATTVCVPAEDGGEYTPAAVTVPTEELPPGMESTSHVTVVTELPVTVAVKVCFWPVVRAARLGPMVTEAVPAPPEEGSVVVDWVACPPPQPTSNKGNTRNAEMNRAF